MRTKFIIATISAIFLLLILYLFNIQLVQGRKFRQLSDKNCIRLMPQYGSRGIIFDRNGNILVDSYLSYDVMLLPKGMDSPEKTLAGISKVLGVAQSELKNNYKSNFISLSLPVTVAENVEVKKAIALEELKNETPEILIQPHPLRHYPYGKLACHVIGYLGEIDRWRLTRLDDYGYKTKDIVGLGGIEEKCDYYLRQEEGALSSEVDHRGKFVRVLGFRPARDGKDVQLTLDLKAQKIVEDVLGERKGAVVVIDPYSGEIIAISSSPGFNPIIFAKKTESAIRDAIRDSDAPMMNRAISGIYPPASVFKLVVATAALEAGKISPTTTFVCQGSTYIGRRQFACWDTHGPQSIIGAIAHSCDVFFYRTGILAGPQPIHDYALLFGFSKSAITDLPYGQNGFIPDPIWKRLRRMQGWYDGDTANFAIGQGDILVTPLQMARMVSVFANKGELVSPYVIKSIAGKDVSRYQKKNIKLNIKQSTINYVRRGMRGVVNDPGGTAKVLADVGVTVAGKTGTAQVSHGDSHAWFVGFFPYENPKYAICVFLEHGGHGYTSAVLARQIISGMSKEGLLDEKF